MADVVTTRRNSSVVTVGIQGPPGPPGEQGTQGEEGPQGDTGPAGPQGGEFNFTRVDVIGDYTVPDTGNYQVVIHTNDAAQVQRTVTLPLLPADKQTIEVIRRGRPRWVTSINDILVAPAGGKTLDRRAVAAVLPADRQVLQLQFNADTDDWAVVKSSHLAARVTGVSAVDGNYIPMAYLDLGGGWYRHVVTAIVGDDGQIGFEIGDPYIGVVHIAGENIKCYVSDNGQFQITRAGGQPILYAYWRSGHGSLMFQQSAVSSARIGIFDSGDEAVRVPFNIVGQSGNGGSITILAGEKGPTKKGSVGIGPSGLVAPDALTIETADIAEDANVALTRRIVALCMMQRLTAARAVGDGDAAGAGDGEVLVADVTTERTKAPPVGKNAVWFKNGQIKVWFGGAVSPVVVNVT